MKSITYLNLCVWVQHLLQCHGDATRTLLRGHQEKGRWHQAAGKELTGRVSQETGLRPQVMSWFLLWTGTKWHSVNSISQWKSRGHRLLTKKSGHCILKAAWPRRLELKEFNRGKKSKIAYLEFDHWHFCCVLGHRSWKWVRKRSSGAAQLITGWGGNAGEMPARRKLNAAT